MKKRKNLLLTYGLFSAFVVLVVSLFSFCSYATTQTLINENINAELETNTKVLLSYLDSDAHCQMREKYVDSNFNESLLNDDQVFLDMTAELDEYKKSFSASNIFTLNFSQTQGNFYVTLNNGAINKQDIAEYAHEHFEFFLDSYQNFNETFIRRVKFDGVKHYIAIRALTHIIEIDNQPRENFETLIGILIPQSAMRINNSSFTTSFILLPLIISLFLLGVGFYIARILKNGAKIFKTISYMAFYDSLTTLPNRAKLIEHLEALLKESNQNKRFAIIFIDIDRFKNVNDSEGHIEGDVLLQKIALFLNSKISKNTSTDKTTPNIISRLGGDEFVVVCPYTNQADLLGFMNNILDDYKILSADDELILKHKVSLSLGAAVYPRDGESVSELLKAADIAMYCAKRYLKTNCLIYNKTLNAIMESNKIKTNKE